MLSSNNNHSLDLRDSLALLEQIIKDFQAARKQLLRLGKSLKSSTEVNRFAVILEAVENSLQKIGSNKYVLDLKDSLTFRLQTEKGKLLHLDRTPESIKAASILASINEVIDSALREVFLRQKQLRQDLDKWERFDDEQLLAQAEAEWQEGEIEIESEGEKSDVEW